MTTWGESLAGEQLPRGDCLQRLAGADLARIVLSVRALPVALPTRISLSEPDGLVFTSNEHSVAVAARRRDVISVQIDGLEDDDSTWSVMVSGIARSAEEISPLRLSHIHEIDHGAKLYVMPLSIITGRRSR